MFVLKGIYTKIQQVKLYKNYVNILEGQTLLTDMRKHNRTIAFFTVQEYNILYFLIFIILVNYFLFAHNLQCFEDAPSVIYKFA